MIAKNEKDLLHKYFIIGVTPPERPNRRPIILSHYYFEGTRTGDRQWHFLDSGETDGPLFDDLHKALIRANKMGYTVFCGNNFISLIYEILHSFDFDEEELEKSFAIAQLF